MFTLHLRILCFIDTTDCAIYAKGIAKRQKRERSKSRNSNFPIKWCPLSNEDRANRCGKRGAH